MLIFLRNILLQAITTSTNLSRATFYYFSMLLFIATCIPPSPSYGFTMTELGLVVLTGEFPTAYVTHKTYPRLVERIEFLEIDGEFFDVEFLTTMTDRAYSRYIPSNDGWQGASPYFWGDQEGAGYAAQAIINALGDDLFLGYTTLDHTPVMTDEFYVLYTYFGSTGNAKCYGDTHISVNDDYLGWSSFKFYDYDSYDFGVFGRGYPENPVYNFPIFHQITTTDALARLEARGFELDLPDDTLSPSPVPEPSTMLLLGVGLGGLALYRRKVKK